MHRGEASDMSSGVISGVATAILIVTFIAGWIWAWSARRKPAFDAAARLPLDDEPTAVGNPTATRTDKREGLS